MNSRRSTQPSTDCGNRFRCAGTHAAGRTAGLTMVELLVALVIGLVIIGLAMSMVMSNRRLYQTDQNRTEANQNLRVSLDLIGADARIAGELMTDPALGLMAIEVHGGSELILRRKIVVGTLPVCFEPGQVLNAGTVTELRVSAPEGNLGELSSFCRWNDDNGNGIPDHVEAYAAALEGNGGQVLAYVYQVGRLEPLVVTGLTTTTGAAGGVVLTVQGSLSGSFEFTGFATDPAIVFMSERHYRVSDTGNLELVVDGNEANALQIANRVDSLVVTATTADGSFADFEPGIGVRWQDVSEIHVEMTSAGSGPGSSPRTLASSFFPRNVLSRGEGL